MSGPVFERLAIVGLGLLGGSVALAARERGLAGEIRAVDPDPSGDPPFPRVALPEAAAWADAVILAVPPASIEPVLAELAPCVGPETIITDTASVKLPVASAARRLLAHPGQCVGAHPMAGSDKGGFTSARVDLLEGAPCILALEGSEPAQVVDRVEEFWQGLGTFTVRLTPDEHDRVAAWLSHGPHVIAFAFAQGLPGAETLRLAGSGLRDFIRIARANPSLWCEILLMNRTRVAEVIARFKKDLDQLERALARGDRAAVLEALNGAQAALEKLD